MSYIPNSFDEAYYLAQNPDVAAAVAAGLFTSGLQHYEISGAHELRNPNAYFDEQYYLFTNPDVAAAVASGIFSSGLEHFEKYGKSEDRAPKAGVAFDEAAYLAAWPDVAAAVQAGAYASGWDHYVTAGAAEGRTAVPPSTGEITSTVSGSVTTLSLDSDSGAVDLTASKLSVDGGAGLSTLHLTGDADVRIDFTNPNNQLRGIDLNTDAVIAANGIENNVSGAGIVTVKNFEIVDAYARDPLNETDHTANFAGAINYDGTGFAGDGVSTDGNIFLGGLGADKAFGGIGNDFLAGGGVGSSVWEQKIVPGIGAAWVNSITGLVAEGDKPSDELHGGRNADFMFAEFSALDNTDGNGTTFDGGSTADDSAAGAGDSGQDTDWLLLEASDDNEPVTVNLGSGSVTLGDGTDAATLVDIENLDASGNLYGFLNDVDVELGGRRVDDRAPASPVGTENYGIGSTGQLAVTGSSDANRIIGGYDNDRINGGAGNDLLIGGNLAFLQANRSNPNLIDANGGLDLNVHTVGGQQLVNDGTDQLVGGAGDDNLVFEMDGGTYEGGTGSGTTGTGNSAITGERDTLWITNFSAGRLAGHTQAEEVADPLASQSDALAAQTKDSTIRLDLGVGHGDLFRGYGGADVLNNQINGQPFTADQSQYNAGGVRTTVQDISDVITTGLGAVDYHAAGTNNPDLTFNNLQNRLGINADLDLRGINVDSNANTLGRQFADGVWADQNFGYSAAGTLATDWDEGDNTLYANTGDDKVEGRAGDDLLSGGTGDDDFFTTQADGTDLIHRQQDANGDNVWDTDAAGNGLFVQDFRAPQAGDITSSRLTIDFGTTDLTSVNVAVTQVNLVIGSTTFAANIALGTHGIDDIAAAVNTAYQAIDADVSVVAVNNALVVTDKQGRDISDQVSEGYVVAGAVANGSLSTTAVFAPGGTPINIVEDDRLIYTAYLDRANNVLVNDAKNSLDIADGGGYASDLVVGFGTDGTTLAANQEWRIQFQNLGEGDTVTVTVNGTSYERTFSKVTDTDTDGFVTNLINQINSTAQDLNTAAGTLVAAQDDVIVGSVNESVLVLTNADVFGDAAVFMDKPEVTVVSSSGATAAVALANTSDSSIELFGFDGRNNALNADDVLFVGQTAQKNGYTAANSRAVLATALTTGGELTGSAALVVKNAGLHGDDQLIGGDGNDIIKGLTGDDRIIGSKGTDTVDGGGNDVGTDGVTAIAYNDVLLFQEGDFGAGTKFTVTLDATLAANTNKGVVTAVDDKGAVLGTTTYTGIELVRTLSNTAADTLNVQALSDAIVTKSGVSLEANEGISIQLTEGAAGLVTVTVDNNNDGDVLDAGEVFTAGRVLGAESIVSGKSNDSVTMDDSQLGSTNNLDLGGETSDTVPVNTFNEGADTAIYQTNLTGADAYTTTVMVGSTADTVSMTGGVLGDKVVIDTLTNVEVLNVDDLNDDANPNSGAFNADVLNLTNFATTGATVNYGGAVTVGKSLGGELGATSVANVEANTLEAGGVSQTGTGLGNELLEVVGITRLEQVIGSDGTDRVIVGNTMESGRIVRNIVDDPAVLDVFDIGKTTYLGNAELDVQDKGLYQFKLGSGNDVLDYDDETQDVGVLVDTNSTSSTDWVLVGSGDLDAVGERIDFATDVERYFGGAGTNTIDLSQATVDTTVQFSKESLLSSNQYADPDGLANGKSLTVDDIVRGNEVRGTADSTVFATFMDRTANAVSGASFWTNVVGNKQAETILLTNNEAATAQTFTLNGGANVVDYSARTAAISAFIGAVDTSDTDLSGKFTLAGDRAAQSVFTSDLDFIDITRGTSFDSGTLKVIGSGQDHDVVDITGLSGSSTFNIVDLAAGTVTEDRFDAATGNFVTQISGFEDITGSLAADRLIGSGSANLISAGFGADGVNGGKGADQIAFGGADGSVDRLYYTATDAGNTADGTIVNSADRVTGFWLPDGDQLVFDTTLLSTINQLGNVKVAAAGGFVGGTDGVLVSTTTTGAASFTAGSTVSLAELQTAFGGIGGSSANKEYVLIAKDTGGESGVFHFKDVDGNGTIDAGDVVTLLSVIDDTDYSAAPTAVVTRQGAAAGSQTINGADNGGTMEVVYSAQNQSTLAARDTIDAFNIGANGPATVDKLDLSQLHLGLSSSDTGFVDKGTYNASGVKTADVADGIDDAIQAVKFRSGVSVDGADTLTDFFNDAAATTAAGTNVDRAVFVQQEAATNAFRVFVDVNRDGDFTQGADMVIDLTNVVDVGGDFNALVSEATGIAEFIGAIRFTEIA